METHWGNSLTERVGGTDLELGSSKLLTLVYLAFVTLNGLQSYLDRQLNASLAVSKWTMNF